MKKDSARARAHTHTHTSSDGSSKRKTMKPPISQQQRSSDILPCQGM
jgi:hypothetical protein